MAYRNGWRITCLVLLELGLECPEQGGEIIGRLLDSQFTVKSRHLDTRP